MWSGSAMYSNTHVEHVVSHPAILGRRYADLPDRIDVMQENHKNHDSACGPFDSRGISSQKSMDLVILGWYLL